MKNSKKPLLVLAIFFFLTIMLLACGRDSTNPKQEIGKIMYEMESAKELFIDVPTQIVRGKDGVWVLTSEKEDNLFFVDNNEMTENISWQEREDEYIIAMSEGAGNFYLCVGMNGENEVQIRRREDASHWNVLTTIHGEEVKMLQGVSFCVDDDETVYFANGSAIWQMPEEGKMHQQEVEGDILFVQEWGKGQIECITIMDGKIIRYKLAEGRFEKEWVSDIGCSQAMGIKCSDNSRIGILSDDKLFWIDRESGEQLQIASLTESGIPTQWLMEASCDNMNERITLYGRSDNYKLTCYTIVKQADFSSEQRKCITYGTINLNGHMQEQIAAFNRENKEYYVAVKYYNGESPGLRLQADLAGGNAPDIIDMYTFGGRYEDFAKQGYLEDLTDYLKKSKQSEDIQWQVLIPGEIDNKIYMLTPHFSLWGLAISQKDMDGVEEWNIDSFFSLIEKNNGEKGIFLSSTPSAVLETALWGMSGEFIDWEKGKADFDSGSFQQLLYFCKKYGKENIMVAGQGYETSDLAEHVLFLDVSVSQPSGYVDVLGVYGRNTPIYGFPTKDGQQYLINRQKDACSIYSGSEYKEGAWEFLNTLLESDFQNKDRGMPICKSIYEEQWKTATKETVRINNTSMMLEESEIDIIDDILNNEKLFCGDLSTQWQEIEIVVLEEAESYFSGDKELQEVTAIIQNRVQLMLDE
ncbi:MAG: extracellular solute-binding protein [Clostridium sp.]|nr:extracellular solute-binding protein [Clostridium sp.]